jgi:hypothetical protein
MEFALLFPLADLVHFMTLQSTPAAIAFRLQTVLPGLVLTKMELLVLLAFLATF